MDEAKRTALERVAEALDGARVEWAIGASLMLYARGVTDAFRDIDLFVNMPDFAKAAEALGGFCGARLAKPSTIYVSEGFACYVLNGVEIDLIGDYAIQCVDGLVRWVARADERRAVDGIELPLAPLADWYRLYRVMPGREKRVREIERWAQAQGISLA